jgi:hypothetical protein
MILLVQLRTGAAGGGFASTLGAAEEKHKHTCNRTLARGSNEGGKHRNKVNQYIRALDSTSCVFLQTSTRGVAFTARRACFLFYTTYDDPNGGIREPECKRFIRTALS